MQKSRIILIVISLIIFLSLIGLVLYYFYYNHSDVDSNNELQNKKIDKTIIYLQYQKLDNKTNIIEKNLLTDESKIIYSITGDVNVAVLSPDGSKIAYSLDDLNSEVGVSIIDLANLKSSILIKRLSNNQDDRSFGSKWDIDNISSIGNFNGIRWSSASNELLLIGSSYEGTIAGVFNLDSKIYNPINGDDGSTVYWNKNSTGLFQISSDRFGAGLGVRTWNINDLNSSKRIDKIFEDKLIPDGSKTNDMSDDYIIDYISGDINDDNSKIIFSYALKKSYFSDNRDNVQSDGIAEVNSDGSNLRKIISSNEESVKYFGPYYINDSRDIIYGYKNASKYSLIKRDLDSGVESTIFEINNLADSYSPDYFKLIDNYILYNGDQYNGDQEQYLIDISDNQIVFRTPIDDLILGFK